MDVKDGKGNTALDVARTPATRALITSEFMIQFGE
jgi:hypothetical protein